MSSKTRPVSALLGENDALRPLLKRARLINALQLSYLDALPEVLRQDLPGSAGHETFVRSSRVTALVGSTLVIGTASAAVATRLKLLVPTLLKQIQKQEQEVTEIRVELQPAWAAPDERPASRQPPRQAIPAAALDALSGQISDSPLKDTVDRIRRRRARQSTKTK